MSAPARAASLRVLQLVDGGATLPDALARERDRLVDARDRALVTELATGSLRWRGALDAELTAASARPWDTVEDAIRNVLRLGAYQLRYLDRIPARAIVDDAVDQAREVGRAKAAGFVNAVLRRLTRTDPAATPPLDSGNLDALAAALSHPAWLLERWLRRYGLDAVRRWTAFDNAAAPLTLRTNRLRVGRDELASALADEGVRTSPTRYAREGLIVLEGQPIGGAAARAGLFVVQDEASQLVGELAAAYAGARMLDACAAPGGKTLILAAGPTPPRLLVAADLRPRRLRLLRDAMRRAGASQVRLAQVDLRRGLPFGAAFDLVLLDAPCSGLGTVRREPDIKWRRSASDLAALAGAQARMIDVAARAVRTGGYLVYATCSSEPEENEEVVQAFLGRTPAFAPVTPTAGVVGTALAGVIDAAGHLRSYPHEHGLEAFFAAVLTRSPGARARPAGGTREGLGDADL